MSLLIKKYPFFFFLLLFWKIFYANADCPSLCLQKEEEARAKPLTLKEAILRNLLQQPAIRVALYNIDIQKGITQSSGAPFDPVINSHIFHTYLRDLIDLAQNVNSLDLGQNLNPLAGIPGANPMGAPNIVPTIAQLEAPCSCPKDSSCGNNSSLAPCPPAIHTDYQAHETNVHLDVSKRFREGTRVLFSLDINQYHNPIACPKRLNVARANLEINQPILRGRAYGIEYMTEAANYQETEAVRYDTLQTISQQVFDTISLYWDTLASKKILQAQRESEERLTKLVEDVKFLIEREQLAEADIVQPLAQLASQVAIRIQAEQNLYASEQRLIFAMGEWDEECPCRDKKFTLVDDFPLTHLNPLSFHKIFCRLFPTVFEKRFDILASIVREGEYVLLLKGAQGLLIRILYHSS